MTDSDRHERQAVIDEAVTWIKTPFAHMQCCKGAGVDCANFLYGVFRNVGFAPVLQIEQYPPDWYLHRNEERFLGWVEKFGRPITGPPFKPGDVVMYRYGRTFAHSAIVVAWPTIIHAFAPARMVFFDDALINRGLSVRTRTIYRHFRWEE